MARTSTARRNLLRFLAASPLVGIEAHGQRDRRVGGSDDKAAQPPCFAAAAAEILDSRAGDRVRRQLDHLAAEDAVPVQPKDASGAVKGGLHALANGNDQGKHKKRAAAGHPASPGAHAPWLAPDGGEHYAEKHEATKKREHGKIPQHEACVVFVHDLHCRARDDTLLGNQVCSYPGYHFAWVFASPMSNVPCRAVLGTSNTTVKALSPSIGR